MFLLTACPREVLDATDLLSNEGLNRITALTLDYSYKLATMNQHTCLPVEGMPTNTTHF